MKVTKFSYFVVLALRANVWAAKREKMQASFIERKISGWLLRQTSTSGVRKVVSAFGAVASEIGNVRNDNQDKAVIIKFFDATGATFVAAVVADGIGGMRDGSRCAAIAVGTFVSQLYMASTQAQGEPELWLEQSVNAANFAVHKEYQGRGGSTLVAVMLHENGELHWASAGDSRLYRFSGNKFDQISVDDTIAGQLGKKGPVPPEHSKILQFVGMGKDFVPHLNREPWKADDQYILTTDGVHYLSDSFEVYSRIVAHSDEIGLTTKRLIDLAKWCGGPDNATVAILRLPHDFSQFNNGDVDSLSVWDAFGELQIQVQRAANVTSGAEQLPDSPSKADQPIKSNQDDFLVIEESSDEEDIETSKLTPTPQRGAKKTARKKKSPQTDEEKAQLDIKFSSKSD